jgi:pyruvate dehydrogenase E1 component alpha subunit
LVTEAYRIEGHYAGEPEVYRSRAEVDEYRKKEPLGHFRSYVLSVGLCSQAELDQVDQEVKQEMVDAVQFAKDSPVPDPATAMDYIYADSLSEVKKS